MEAESIQEAEDQSTRGEEEEKTPVIVGEDESLFSSFAAAGVERRTTTRDDTIEVKGISTKDPMFLPTEDLIDEQTQASMQATVQNELGPKSYESAHSPRRYKAPDTVDL